MTHFAKGSAAEEFFEYCEKQKMNNEKDPHVPELSEEARRAIDILEKWTEAVIQEWIKISTELDNLKVGSPDPLDIEDENGNRLAQIVDVRFLVRIDANISRPIRDAIESGIFNLATLSVIRRRTLEIFTFYRKKIAKTKEEIRRSKEKQINKLNDTLPKIIDEFGADIMQFGAPSKDKGPSLAVPSFTFSNDPNAGAFHDASKTTFLAPKGPSK